MKSNYFLIVVDTKEEAQELNKKVPAPTDLLKIEAVYLGQIVHGKRHGIYRPNIVINKTSYPDLLRLFESGGRLSRWIRHLILGLDREYIIL